MLHLRAGQDLKRGELTAQLVEMQFERTNADLKRGQFRLRGQVLEIMPVNEEIIYRFEIDAKINLIELVDPITRKIKKQIEDAWIFPARHYVASPDLKAKVELIINAVQVAHALGNPRPRVAVLSATEFVQAGLQSTLDAAALAKMSDRGQIKGCVVDGPFALDNALSDGAAAEKKITSEVAGKAEILLAHTIEAANSLAKSTTYLAGFRLAHVIVGAKVPILIPSRADTSDAKLLSIALGVLMCESKDKQK